MTPKAMAILGVTLSDCRVVAAGVLRFSCRRSQCLREEVFVEQWVQLFDIVKHLLNRERQRSFQAVVGLLLNPGASEARGEAKFKLSTLFTAMDSAMN